MSVNEIIFNDINKFTLLVVNILIVFLVYDLKKLINKGDKMFSKKLNKKLDQYHLLNHPFYKSWNEGKLTREIIKDYAEQYYQHVKAFPRYISATHSLCEDIEKRKILLENLNDEENRDADHPKLWKNFALAMDADARRNRES